MTCTHKIERERWIQEENRYTGDIDEYWETTVEYTTEDIDTHRYKCTQCGKIMYYSGAAKEYYENGTDTKGLFS